MSKKRASTSSGRSHHVAAYLAVALIVAAAGASWYWYSMSAIAAKPKPSLLYARIDTSFGSIEIELFPSAAPKTVANFVQLANEGFYNNLVWHRIVKGFVIQTGDPLTRNGGGNSSLWGTGGSSSTVPLEIDPALHNNESYIGMARGQDPNSGSSQFYINLGNNTFLDGSYTVFGKVIGGMNIAQEIGNAPVNSQDQPLSLVYVTKITILSTP